MHKSLGLSPSVSGGLGWSPRMCISNKLLGGRQDHIWRTVLEYSCSNKAFMPLLCYRDFCGHPDILCFLFCCVDFWTACGGEILSAKYE